MSTTTSLEGSPFNSTLKVVVSPSSTSIDVGVTTRPGTSSSSIVTMNRTSLPTRRPSGGPVISNVNSTSSSSKSSSCAATITSSKGSKHPSKVGKQLLLRPQVSASRVQRLGKTVKSELAGRCWVISIMWSCVGCTFFVEIIIPILLTSPSGIDIPISCSCPRASAGKNNTPRPTRIRICLVQAIRLPPLLQRKTALPSVPFRIKKYTLLPKSRLINL